MKDIVFIPGIFDLLHFGHIKFIERASKFGDVIIVGVESDELTIEEKGRDPIIKLKDRMLALEGLKYVDIVVPFFDFDYVSYCKQYHVDTLILSDLNKNSDKKRFIDVVNFMENNGKKIIYLPYSHDISSTKIREEIRQKILCEKEENDININSWEAIWEKVGSDNLLDDIRVVGDALNNDKVKILANYMIEKLEIQDGSSILDFGCGSGVMMKIIEKDMEYKNCRLFGIDISEGMINRAIRNMPDGIFLASDHIPLRNKIDHIICYGVMHYLPSLEHVAGIIDEMKNISDSIIIMELPDMAKKELREEHRNKIGKNKYPEQLYFDKKWFKERGFEVFDNEISVTNNSDYGFTAVLNG